MARRRAEEEYEDDELEDDEEDDSDEEEAAARRGPVWPWVVCLVALILCLVEGFTAGNAAAWPKVTAWMLAAIGFALAADRIGRP